MISFRGRQRGCIAFTRHQICFAETVIEKKHRSGRLAAEFNTFCQKEWCEVKRRKETTPFELRPQSCASNETYFGIEQRLENCCVHGNEMHARKCFETIVCWSRNEEHITSTWDWRVDRKPTWEKRLFAEQYETVGARTTDSFHNYNRATLCHKRRRVGNRTTHRDKWNGV